MSETAQLIFKFKTVAAVVVLVVALVVVVVAVDDVVALLVSVPLKQEHAKSVIKFKLIMQRQNLFKLLGDW